MATRTALPSNRITAAALEAREAYHKDVVAEVVKAVAEHDVVVVGMGINPFVKRARAALDEAGIAYHYLEYGSYFSAWKERLAIKMWSGWPTFPQVFVKGTLIGGTDLTKAAIADGTLKSLVAGTKTNGEAATA